MFNFTNNCSLIFEKSIHTYHDNDQHQKEINNPYQKGTIENLLYLKNWIDCGQWSLESSIRFDPNIPAEKAFDVKKKIDESNQRRTDVVEEIDNFFCEKFKDVKVEDDATVNTESPAWAIDRLSILALKIHHMKSKAENGELSDEVRAKGLKNLVVLEGQQVDLKASIEDLLEDIAVGRKFMKLYKAMKMYNDPTLNPVLYSTKNNKD
jgi:hypothetical protein